MRLNPAIENAPSYPFLRVAEARHAARARGLEVIDLTLGQPSEPAPPAVRDALVDAAGMSLSEYPATAGLGELREAIAAWLARRFGVRADPDHEILPTLGAKEPIGVLARLFAAPGDGVALGTPSYPVAERSALACGVRVERQTLDAAGAWLPDPDAVPWGRVAIVWVVNPHNPTGAVAGLDLLEALAERCRRSGAILAVDETYSEFYFCEHAPPSALQLADRSGVVVFNSLSKRSALAGLRCGFVAGDGEIVSRLRRHRSDTGTTPPALIQRAAACAWRDEQHVQRARDAYAHRRELLGAAAREAGLPHAGGPAGIFLWLGVPDRDDRAAFDALLARSLLVVPGSYLGAGGEGHLRVSLTPPLHTVERAAALLRAGVAVGA